MSFIRNISNDLAGTAQALVAILVGSCAAMVIVALVVPLGEAQAQPSNASGRGWKPVVKVADRLIKRPKLLRKSNRLAKPRKGPLAAKDIKAASARKPMRAPPLVTMPKRRSRKRVAMVQHSDVTRKYCENISDAAADARLAWQKRELSKLRTDLDDRLKKLASRTSELKSWLQRRKAFVKSSQKGLVRIYAGMRPDVAALQLVAMDELTASSLLARFKPRVASTILNEMKPKIAARLASIIAGAAKVQAREKAPVEPAEKPKQ